MTKFDWLMLAAWTVIFALLVNASAIMQPVARSPDPVFDELPARVDAIEDRLDRIEGKLAELLERLPRLPPNLD